MKGFSREEIRDRLDKRILSGRPILICEAGAGIIAKFAERGDADLIIASSLGTMRMNGVDDSMAHKPYGNSNEMTGDLVNRLRFAVEDIPVIAGVNPSDPWVFLEDHITTMFRMGISGVVNSPSWGATDQSRVHIERLGFGVPLEIEFLRDCRAKDIFTVANAYTHEEALRFAEIQPDMQIINLRYVVENATNPELYNDLSLCCEYVMETYKALKEISPDSYIVVHGGPFTEYDKVKRLFELTQVEGFVGSSYFDEKLMSRYITQNQQMLQGIRLR